MANFLICHLQHIWFSHQRIRSNHGKVEYGLYTPEDLRTVMVKLKKSFWGGVEQKEVLSASHQTKS